MTCFTNVIFLRPLYVTIDVVDQLIFMCALILLILPGSVVCMLFYIDLFHSNMSAKLTQQIHLTRFQKSNNNTNHIIAQAHKPIKKVHVI